MKRLLKTSIALVLVFALAIASGTTTMNRAQAAETTGTPIDLTTFREFYEKIKTTTGEAMKASVSCVDTSLSISLTEEPIEISMTTLTDPVTRIFKSTTKTGDTVRETYTDPAKGLVYSYSEARKCYEFAPMSSAASGSIISLDTFDSSLFEKLSDITKFSMDSAATYGGKPCVSVTIEVKAGEKQMKSLSKQLLKSFGSTLDFLTDIMSEFKMKPADLFKSLEMTAHIYADPTTNLLLGMDYKGILGIDLGMEPIPIVISGTSANTFVTDSVVLPAETETAVLAAGLTRNKNGLVLRSVAKGAATEFMVSGVTKKKAKSLTIPATMAVCGTSYPVSSAAQNVFRIATKLKKLTVGDSTLKKALVKKPSQYGLRSNINIK